MVRKTLCFLLLIATTSLAQNRPTSGPAAYETIIRGGTVYDGSGGAPRRVDIGIKGDHIAAIGDLKSETASTIIDATGLAVAPGFINMLSHSESSLITDGRSQGELRQGVTTQIFGEGSMGPLSDEMKRRRASTQGDIKFEIPWTTLSEYLTISKNTAYRRTSHPSSARQQSARTSSVSKGKVHRRSNSMASRPCPEEMEAGALGVTTALIYPPAFYAKTEELIELCKVAAKYKGKYIAHIRSEGTE